MTDTTAGKPFNALFAPSPFRVPNLILWSSGVLIGFGMIALGYFAGTPTSGQLPMMILIGASVLVSGCTLIAHNQRGGRLAAYAGVAMLVASASWLAFDDFQSRRDIRAAEARFAADLNALCREEGGQNLADPACARYGRVFDNYHYPNGVPVEVRELRGE